MLGNLSSDELYRIVSRQGLTAVAWKNFQQAILNGTSSDGYPQKS